MTLSRKIIVRKQTLQTTNVFFFLYLFVDSKVPVLSDVSISSHCLLNEASVLTRRFFKLHF